MRIGITLLSALVATTSLIATASAQPCVGQEIEFVLDPPVPKVGDTITITAINESATCAYAVPSSCLYIKVFGTGSCSGTQVVPFRQCLLGQIPLGPGASYSDVWDQKTMTGGQVPAGSYSFQINLLDPNGASLTFCLPVEITSCPTPPSFYGSASAGAGGFTPRWTVSTVPAVGQPFAFAVEDGLGGAPAILFIGPFQGQLAAGWGEFLLSPPFLQVPLALGGAAGAAGAGALNFAFVVPNDAALVGLGANLQMLIADPASSGGISHTRGLNIVICS